MEFLLTIVVLWVLYKMFDNGKGSTPNVPPFKH